MLAPMQGPGQPNYIPRVSLGIFKMRKLVRTKCLFILSFAYACLQDWRCKKAAPTLIIPSLLFCEEGVASTSPELLPDDTQWYDPCCITFDTSQVPTSSVMTSHYKVIMHNKTLMVYLSRVISFSYCTCVVVSWPTVLQLQAECCITDSDPRDWD